jgi:hypothetical protein
VQPTVSTVAQRPPKRRRRYRWLWISLTAFVLLIIAGFIYAAWPGRSTFTVSPETTYVTGPLDKDGCVDYVTALNERLRGNIKPEENANVLLWQALGPKPEGAPVSPAHFQWLGIDPPPEVGEYFISVRKLEYSREKREELADRMVRLGNKGPWRAQDEPELFDWLKRNEKPLALVIAASKLPNYYNPVVPSKSAEDYSEPRLISALLPNVQVCRELAVALRARAMLRIQEGKVDEAWQDLIACHRLAQLVGRGGSAIAWLVGIALDAVAAKGDIAFLEHTKLTSQEILNHLQELRQIPTMPSLADELDLYERFQCLDALLCVAHHWPDMSDSSAPGRTSSNPAFLGKCFTRSVNWDLALRNVNQSFDGLRDASRITDRRARSTAIAIIERDSGIPTTTSKGAEKLLMGPKSRGDQIGRVMMGLLLPAVDKLENAADRTEQNRRNLHLAFALAAYHADQGRYPETLAELAPKYLNAIPDDIFSGRPLIYKPEANGYLLYSVGVNGIDDGGRSFGDDPPGDDLVVRMPVPVPKVKK